NEYVYKAQARGMQLRENVRNIGAQVLEQVVRSAYSNNGTGTGRGTAQHLRRHT
ncbi:beta-1,4-galactosyltransferase 5, partial [Clarias magur]